MANIFLDAYNKKFSSSSQQPTPSTQNTPPSTTTENVFLNNYYQKFSKSNTSGVTPTQEAPVQTEVETAPAVNLSATNIPSYIGTETLTQAKPDTLIQKVVKFFDRPLKDILTKPFQSEDKRMQEDNARAQVVKNVADSIAKNNNVPANQIDLNKINDNLDAFTKDLGVRNQVNDKEFLDLMMGLSLAPIVATAGVLPTLVGIGTFTALSLAIDSTANAITGKKEGLKGFLPEGTPKSIEDVVDIIDLVGKMALTHQAFKAAPGATEFLLRQKGVEINMPRTVELDPVKVKDIFQTGTKMSPEELNLWTSLHLTPQEIKVAIDKGVKVEVPWERVVTVTDRPYWAKLKKTLGLPPSEPKVKRELVGGDTRKAPAGLLEAPTETKLPSEKLTEKTTKYLLDQFKENPVVAHLPYIEGNPFATLTPEQALKLRDEVSAIETPTKENVKEMLHISRASAYTDRTPVTLEELASKSQIAKRAFEKADILPKVTQAEIERTAKTPKTPKLPSVKEKPLEPLIQEARKYKSADEFVNRPSGLGEYDYLYHTSPTKNLESIKTQGIKPSGERPIYFAQDLKSATRWGNKGEPIFRVPKNEISVAGSGGALDNPISKEVVSPNKLEVSIDGGKTWNPLLSKSQLTDIWNKAQKVKPKTALSPKKKVTPTKGSKVVSVPRENLPVGTGEVKASRLESRVAKLSGKIRLSLDRVGQDQIDRLGLTTYKKMNENAQIEAASKYVIDNPDEAMEVLLGNREAPKGLLRNSIYVAMSNNAVGDLTLARKLASLESTRYGQEIDILKKLDPDSSVSYMSDVVKFRSKAVENKYNKPVKEVVNKEVKKIKASTKAPSKGDWQSFIDSIEC